MSEIGMFRGAIIAMLVAGVFNAADGQTSKITGTVTRDTADNRLPGADVSIPSINRSTKTNYLGEFRFERLAAGTYSITIKQVGFEPLTDTITVGPNAAVDRWFLMRPAPVDLRPVVTTAAPEQRNISPALRDFEERRRSGFGHFISEKDLRDGDNRDFANILVGRIPGLLRFRVPMDDQGGHGQIYVGSARKCGYGPAIIGCKGQGSYCPVTLYVDGVVVYSAANQKDESAIPDLAQFRTSDYAGVEYYPGGAALPARFNMTSSGCGAMLLWTREK